MALKDSIKNTAKLKQKYDFYAGLGYSEEAASVLSCFTYGNNRTVNKFFKELGEENLLAKIYDFVGDDDIDVAVQRIYEKYSTRRYNYDNIPNSSIRLAGVAKSASKGRAKVSEPEDGAMVEVGAPMGIRMSFSEDLPDGFMESISTDSYAPIEEKDAKGVFAAPTSTFRMTTTTASMGIVMNQIRNDRDVDLSQVRIEELLNYFDYDNPKPKQDTFNISTEILDKSDTKKLLYINVQAKSEIKEHQNIILLLDVSGSMSRNTEVTQQSIAVIVSKLKIGDIFSLVTYSSVDEIVLKNYAIRSDYDKEYIMGKVLTLLIDGGTYGSKGIETAYEIGKHNYDAAWNNQVILITDGDLNFGITDKGGLEKLIEEKKKENLFLSVIGTGLWNYQDEKLEVLAKHGNGTYCVVNSLEDVSESINKRYESLTNIVAKDVKTQVEFNPKYVKKYRLLGYENRELSHEDFKNDKVISEPYGSGGHGIALYELTMNDGSATGGEFKYQTAVVNDSDELCTIKLRYKEPLADTSHEIEHVVKLEDGENKNARLAYLLYCISEQLRGSDKLDDTDRKFLADAIAEKSYEDFVKLNGEKLKSFIEAYTKNNK